MKRIWTCLALLVLTVVLAVSASAAIEIDTADELSLLMQGDSAYPWDGDYVLTASINMAGKTQAPIGNTITAFTGTFDGGEHTISGISLSGAGRIALFGKINSATIKNVTVEGTVSSTANCAAGIVAEAVISATIENCHNKCDVTVTNACIAGAGILGYVRDMGALTVKDCTNEGDITAARALGGIVGWINEKDAIDATISGCSNSGAIKSTRVVTNASTSAEADMADVGGILGVAGGYVSDKTAAGTGKITVTQCKNSGSVEGYFYIGGIVGRMWGSDTSMTNAKHVVSECWNSGEITSLRNNGRAHVGGIIGYVNQVGNIYDCLNTGVIKGITDGIGGLFGSSGGSGSGIGAKNCLNTVPVQTYGTAVSYSGYNKTNYVNSIGGYMAAKPAGTCYYTGTLQGSVWTNGSAKSTQYTESLFNTLNANGVWTNAASPMLSCFLAAHTHSYDTYKDLGNGTHIAACICGEADPSATAVAHTYTDGVCACGAGMPIGVITTAEELLVLMNASALWADGEYSLGNTIDLSTYTGGLSQKPIGNATTPFKGSFDGAGYTISGLDIDESGDNVGLFGAVGSGAVITDLTVEGSVKGANYVGGIIGIVGTTSSGASVTVENCHNKATVSGTGKVGGVVGYFHGSDFEAASVKNCTNSGKVTATGEDVGGVAGILWEATAANCTNTAAVTTNAGKVGGVIGRATGSLDISGLRNSGAVQGGGNYVGGVLGHLMNCPSAILSECENSGTVTSTGAAGGVIGVITLRAANADSATVEILVNKASGTVTGGEYAGGIIGAVHGSTGITATIGTSNSVTIRQCENFASVSGTRYGGGIIGAFRGADTANATAKGVLTECQNSGRVSTDTTADTNGMGADCGGIAGLLYAIGDVNNCRNTGAVHGAVQYVGGFVGRTVSYVNINNCYADCTVTCDKADAGYVRAFVGYPSAKKMNNCYFNADKCSAEATNESEFAAAGGTTPKPYSGLVFDALNGDGKWVAMTSPELKLFHTVHDNTQGGIDNGNGTHTPICPCGDESTRGTTVSHTYDETGFCGCGSVVTLASAISTADQLVTLMQYSNLWDGDYVLTKNINLSGKPQATIGNAVTPFTGTFDGQGYTISNLKLSGETNIGLFGVAVNAEIRNLTVSGTVTATGYYAGGIVAYAGVRNGTTNTFIIENCRNNATVTGDRYVGGVVGYFVGSDTAANGKTENVIRNCYNSGAVTATSTGEANEVGGVAGILWNIGEASNLYATGKVTASNSNAGGIIGRMTGYANVAYSYANATVVGATAGISYIRAFCGKPDYSDGIVACYYNPDKTSNEDTNVGWRVYDEAAFAYLNADGAWVHASLPELTLFHTKHNNKLAWIDNGDGTHSPICPCGAEASKGTAQKHTYDVHFICTACGNADRCAHLSTEIYVDGTPNCLTDVLSWERCADCQVKLTADGEETVITASADYHDYAWTVVNGETVCVCTFCDEVKPGVTAPEGITVLYVSTAGTPSGGFSADAPLNDFDVAMQIAAAAENDVTIYILDQASIPFPAGAVASFTYLEPAHTNTITICGTENARGVLRCSDADKKMIYGLNGPTVFENVEFSFGNTAAYLYLVARHNPLVLGEGISVDFNRVNGSSTHSGNIYVIGGCYESYFASNCAGKSIDVEIHSGTYRTIIGGHYSGKNCGTACDISLKLLGDITTRQQICAGNVGADSGDLTITVDGNLSIGTYFTFGTQTVDKRASSTTVILESGSIVLNSFFANPNSGLSALTIGSLNATTNVLSFTQQLTVYTNEDSASAMALRETVLASVFSAPNQASDFASKVLFLFKNADDYCDMTGGAHTPNGGASSVTASTCTVQGYEIYHCSACDTDYKVTLPLAGHTVDAGNAITIAATCIAPEMEKNYCTACGLAVHTITGSEFAEHTDPEKTGYCQVCNLDLTANCEHEYGAGEPFKSGCGDGTKYTCNKCGKVEVEVFGDGHNYGKYVVTVEPTATMAGIKSRTCKGCGKVETALLYATDAINAEAVATDASGNLADFVIENAKLTKGEKAALNALLQQDAYGSEIKISYETDGDTVSNITYSIPVPAEYTDYENVMVVVRDDEGTIHFVDFKIEKGYIVFTF